MNTFLPYPNFEKSTKCLDNKRLGKQRIEAWQIYNALKNGKYGKCIKGYGEHDFCVHNSTTKKIHCVNCGKKKIKTAWYNHPITQMWKGYELSLLVYGFIICKEWRERGYKDKMLYKFAEEIDELLNKDGFDNKCPSWLGNKKFHASMRSNLLRKDKKWYSQFGWKETDSLPYSWMGK